MANVKSNEYRPSPVVAKMVANPDICWNARAYEFRLDMLRLQADLIRLYWSGMDAETQERAAKTLRWIETQLSGAAL